MLRPGTNQFSNSIFLFLLEPGFWFGVFLLAYNNLINFLPPILHAQIYVWLNMGVLCLIWIWSRRYLNLNHIDLGITIKNLGISLLIGLGLTLMVVLPFLILLLLLPSLGFDVKTPRLEEIAHEIFWWRIFVRIPLGTALFEEMLFRGFFYGYLIKKTSHKKTLWVTSLFFAFWHITPAFKVISLDLQIVTTMLFILLWLVGLLGSFIAGLLFAWIRYRTNNIAGCILAHACINDLALVIASLVWE